MEDVIVVPLRLNGFYVSKKRGNKGVYLYGKALPSDTNLITNPIILFQHQTKAFKKNWRSWVIDPWYISET